MTAREVGISVCATAVNRLKAVTLRSAASSSAGQCRSGSVSRRPVARASSNSRALPTLSPTARMLQIGISFRASLTAGQLNPQDTAITIGQALAAARRGCGGSEGEVGIVLAGAPKGWRPAPQGAQNTSEAQRESGRASPAMLVSTLQGTGGRGKRACLEAGDRR